MARESVRPSSAITSSTPLPVGRRGGREGRREGGRGENEGRWREGGKGGGVCKREGGRTLFADSLRWHSRKLSLLAEEVRVAMATPCRQQL